MIEGEQSPIADLFELSNYYISYSYSNIVILIFIFFNRQCQDLDLMAFETFPIVSICTYFLDATQHELKHCYVISLMHLSTCSICMNLGDCRSGPALLCSVVIGEVTCDFHVFQNPSYV